MLRRLLRSAALALAGLVLAGPALADKLPRLVLAGPPASVSNPLIHMVESGALADLAEQVEFVTWRDPDQLRLMALDGKADVLAMPVNVAANLYNRGAKLRLLNVSTWGMLWLVSRETGLTRMSDLRGKEITVPYRGDMPDILFGLLAERDGVDVRKDLKIRYVASPMDAMQLLLIRRTDHALLAEPAISMALRKSGSIPLALVAPELHRSIDLQQEWGRLLGRKARIPQAGIALMASVKDDPAIAARIAQAYADSLAWCSAHPQDCGTLVAGKVPMLSAEAIADSMAHSRLQAVPTAEAQAELEYFLGLLHAKNPALIGGKLPPADFYAQDTARP